MIPSSTPHLVLTAETTQYTQYIDLSIQKTWTLGRSSINAIVLPEQSVSRHHAKLEVVDNRYCYFVDLNSSNGSQVNYQRVTKPLLLKHGDVITVGATQIRFHFPYVTHTGATVPFRPKQVLMLHESATQGILWQEILYSQEFDVQWIQPSTDLYKRISLDAAANVLPDLLLVDINAYRGDALALGAWCNDIYPQLPFFLTLSAKSEVSIVDTLPSGLDRILPALPAAQLLQQVDLFIDSLQMIFQRIGDCTLNHQALVACLETLDTLPSQANIPPVPTDQVDDDQEEFTILNNEKKLQVR